jgi:hypothetical protein
VERVNGEDVPCSWVAPGICTACMTADEQLIVASLMENLPERSPLALEEERAQLQRALFPRFLQARISTIVEPLTDGTKRIAIDEAWSLAELAAAQVLPEPSRIVRVG